MSLSQGDLAHCGEIIDDLDLQLLELLNQRTSVVKEIGRIKQELQPAVYEPKREEEVFANVLGHNGGPLTSNAVQRIFERIIDEMRAVHQRKIVGKD
jgi:chorismate mutase